MKRCPTCNLAESDNSFVLCHADGSPLAETASQVERGPQYPARNARPSLMFLSGTAF